MKHRSFNLMSLVAASVLCLSPTRAHPRPSASLPLPAPAIPELEPAPAELEPAPAELEPAPAELEPAPAALLQADGPAQASSRSVPARGPVPHYHAVRASAPPKIDGRLDDLPWRDAPADDRFVQKFPDERGAPSERTEVRVLYDDSALYLGIRCWDRRPREIISRLTRRDRETDADRVSVDISSRNDRATAYHFDLNVAGVQVDGVRFNDSDYSSAWDGPWYGATTRDGQGWSAELRIPLEILRYEGHTTAFGLQVRRYLQRRQEIDEWAYIPRTAQGEVSNYGVLDGLNQLRAQRLFHLVPYLAGKLTLRGGQPPLDGLTPSGNLGVDLRLGLTPALTLDATINPDFGQVEADRAVLNLGTFELFYPEKRPFFLDGSEIFATTWRQFYTRRIGRAPPAPALPGGAALAEPAPEGRIWGAVKLAGLIGRRLSIGALAALTARQDADIALPDGTRRTLLIDPLTSFGVLRLKQEFGPNSYVGLLATAVNRLEPPGQAAPDPEADLCPTLDDSIVVRPKGGRCFSDAYTAGADLRLRTADGVWGGEASVVGSLISAGPVQQLPDGTLIDPLALGWGISAEVGKYGGEHWLGNLQYFAVSPTLSLNDAGYVGLANNHSLEGLLAWRSTTPIGPMLETSLSLHLVYLRSWDQGDTLGAYGGLQGYARFRNFWQINFKYEPFLPFIDNRETRDGARTERAGGPYAIVVSGKTDPRRGVVGQLSSTLRSVRDGMSLSASATLSLRPTPALTVDLIGHGGWTYGDPRWFATVPAAGGTRSYYFADLDSRTFDLTLRGTYTFTRHLTLDVYAQLFLASGHYDRPVVSRASGDDPVLGLDSFASAPLPPRGARDFRKGSVNLNLLLRWEFRPGSTLLAVYTRAQQQTPFLPGEGIGQLGVAGFSGGPATDVFLIKLSYLWAPLQDFKRLQRGPASRQQDG